MKEVVDDAVKVLVGLLPELEAYGKLLTRDHSRTNCRTFSHRHVDLFHFLGLSCFPIGSNEHDARRVSLIVSIIGINELTIRGYVRQGVLGRNEAEVVTCRNPSANDLAEFCQSVGELFEPLRAAIERSSSLSGEQAHQS